MYRGDLYKKLKEDMHLMTIGHQLSFIKGINETDGISIEESLIGDIFRFYIGTHPERFGDFFSEKDLKDIVDSVREGKLFSVYEKTGASILALLKGEMFLKN